MKEEDEELVEVAVMMPKIQGYEYTGEYRPPKKREDSILFGTTKCFILRPERYRADKGCSYWGFDSKLFAIESTDGGLDSHLDNEQWNCGNYFNTKEDCQAAIDKIKNILLENP